MAFVESIPITFFCSANALYPGAYGSIYFNSELINNTEYTDFLSAFLSKYKVGESLEICFAPQFKTFIITKTSSGVSYSFPSGMGGYYSANRACVYSADLPDDYFFTSFRRLNLPRTLPNKVKLWTEEPAKTPYTQYQILTPNGFEGKEAISFIPSKYNAGKGSVSSECQARFGDSWPYIVFVGVSFSGFQAVNGEWYPLGSGNWNKRPVLSRLPRLYHGISSLFGSGFDFRHIITNIMASNIPVKSQCHSLKWIYFEGETEPITNWSLSAFWPYSVNIHNSGYSIDYHDGYWGCYGSDYIDSCQIELRTGVNPLHCYYLNTITGESIDLPSRGYSVETASIIKQYVNFHFVDVRNNTASKLLQGWIREEPVKPSSSVFPHAIAIDLLSGSGITASSGLSAACRLPLSINLNINTRRS